MPTKNIPPAEGAGSYRNQRRPGVRIMSSREMRRKAQRAEKKWADERKKNVAEKQHPDQVTALDLRMATLAVINMLLAMMLLAMIAVFDLGRTLNYAMQAGVLLGMIAAIWSAFRVGVRD